MTKGLIQRSLLVAATIILFAGASDAEGQWTKHSIVSGWDGMRGTFADDLDGDGDMDILGAARYVNTIAWWENRGSSFVQHILSDTFAGAWDVNTCDMDGDGDKDILGAALTDWELSVWVNTGHVNIWPKVVVDTNCHYAKSVWGADLDGDGDGEVIGASFGSDYMNWFENLGNGDFSEHMLQNNFLGARDIYTIDIDGDGDLEILGAGDNTGAAVWWNDGNLHFTYDLIQSLYGIRSIYGADLTGDGQPEVLAASSYFNACVFWEWTGGGWAQTVIGDNFSFANTACAGDIDNDGDNDVVVSDYDADSITWWENVNGDGTSWVEHTVALFMDGIRWVYAADIDGDGDNDVLGTASHSGELAWFENLFGATPIPITVDLIPHDPLFTLPPGGGVISYDLRITSELLIGHIAQAYTEAKLPPGYGYYGPLAQTMLVVPPGEIYRSGLTQAVPAAAPPGYYYYIARLLEPGTTHVVTADSFAFRKLGPVPDGALDDWLPGDFILSDSETGQIDEGADLPSEYALREAYPNPFNPSTSVEVSLPENADLTVVVTNINGRQVATLARGVQSAGVHHYSFDASGMASGLYFIRAIVPGRMNAVQKVMLVR